MKKEFEAKVAGMTVAEMRKEAGKYGIKNAKQYKRAELEPMLAEKMFEQWEIRQAELEVLERSKKEKEAKEAVEAQKAAKAVKSEKRYKADDLNATKEEIDKMADDIVGGNWATLDLWQVNRKVLIVVMKKLKCAKWYRTYDKPAMINKITAAFAA